MQPARWQHVAVRVHSVTGTARMAKWLGWVMYLAIGVMLYAVTLG